MSPVSRKRKPKKDRRPTTSAPGVGWSSPRIGAWWTPRIDDVLGATDGLLDAPGPRELEQATAELIGGTLHRALSEETAGFDLGGWLGTLIDRARRVITPGHWRLLLGIAAIAPEPLAAQARKHADRMARHGLAGPDWLAAVPAVAPTGEVHLLRNAYGSRFGLVVACGYPAGAGPDHVLLLDLDACSQIVETVDASVHDDARAARDEWCAGVGPTAASAAAEQVDAELLADVLPRGYYLAMGVMGNESRRRMDNHYRIMRRGDDLVAALAAAGRPLPDKPRLVRGYEPDIDPYVTDFAAWYSTRHPEPADDEVVEALVAAWVDGTLPETHLSCSPHRIAALQSVIGLEWRDDPLVGPLAALLPEWTLWCAERTGLGPDLAARSVAAARRDVAEWKRVADERDSGSKVLE